MAELIRKTIPETIPIQCSARSDRPTISPARCRVGSSPGENTVGATTNAKKINPPSQTTSARSIRKRRNAIRRDYRAILATAYPQAEPALSLTRNRNRIYFQRSPYIGRRTNSPHDRFACCCRCELCELEVGGFLRAV